MVRLAKRDSTAELIPGLLEDITERGAGVSTDEFVPRGTRLELIADGFRAHAVVVECTERDSDWHASLAFEPGYGWHPALWEPDHLYRVPAGQTGQKLRGRAADSTSH